MVNIPVVHMCCSLFSNDGLELGGGVEVYGVPWASCVLNFGLFIVFLKVSGVWSKAVVFFLPYIGRAEVPGSRLDVAIALVPHGANGCRGHFLAVD